MKLTNVIGIAAVAALAAGCAHEKQYSYGAPPEENPYVVNENPTVANPTGALFPAEEHPAESATPPTVAMPPQPLNPDMNGDYNGE